MARSKNAIIACTAHNREHADLTRITLPYVADDAVIRSAWDTADARS